MWKSRYQGTNFCQAFLGNVSRSWQKFAPWYLLFHHGKLFSTRHEVLVQPVEPVQIEIGWKLFTLGALIILIATETLPLVLGAFIVLVAMGILLWILIATYETCCGCIK